MVENINIFHNNWVDVIYNDETYTKFIRKSENNDEGTYKFIDNFLIIYWEKWEKEIFYTSYNDKKFNCAEKDENIVELEEKYKQQNNKDFYLVNDKISLIFNELNFVYLIEETDDNIKNIEDFLSYEDNYEWKNLENMQKSLYIINNLNNKIYNNKNIEINGNLEVIGNLIYFDSHSILSEEELEDSNENKIYIKWNNGKDLIYINHNNKYFEESYFSRLRECLNVRKSIKIIRNNEENNSRKYLIEDNSNSLDSLINMYCENSIYINNIVKTDCENVSLNSDIPFLLNESIIPPIIDLNNNLSDNEIMKHDIGINTDNFIHKLEQKSDTEDNVKILKNVINKSFENICKYNIFDKINISIKEKFIIENEVLFNKYNNLNTIRLKNGIPKIMHFIWIGKNIIPDLYIYYIESWIKNHEDWLFFFWNDNNIPKLINQKEYDNSNTYAMKADILRYELLYIFGGIYIDCDFLCLKNIESLIENYKGFSAYESEEFVAIGIMGFVENDKILENIIKYLPISISLKDNNNNEVNKSGIINEYIIPIIKYTVPEITGPIYFTFMWKLFTEYKEMMILEYFENNCMHSNILELSQVNVTTQEQSMSFSNHYLFSPEYFYSYTFQNKLDNKNNIENVLTFYDNNIKKYNEIKYYLSENENNYAIHMWGYSWKNNINNLEELDNHIIAYYSLKKYPQVIFLENIENNIQYKLNEKIFSEKNKNLIITDNLENNIAEETKAERMIQDKNIVLITSVINCVNFPLCYNNIRTVFTTEERYVHTLRSIKSVQKYIPNVEILFCECSDLSNENNYIEENIKNKVDYYCNFYNNEKIKNSVNGLYKGYGEANILLGGLAIIEELIKNGKNYNNLFKLSGRYYMNDTFQYDKFNNNENNFTLWSESNVAYSTIFYKINMESTKLNNMSSIYIFKNILLNMFNEVKNEASIECLFYKYFKKNIKIIEKLNIIGYLSTEGYLFEI